MKFNLKKNRGSFFFSAVLFCTCCTNFNYEGVKEEQQGPPATPQPIDIDPLTSPNGNPASPEDPSKVVPSDNSTSPPQTNQLFVKFSPTDIPDHLIVCTKDQERFTMALYDKSDKKNKSRKFCSFRSHSKQYDPEKKEYVESDGNMDGEENKDCYDIVQEILLEKPKKGWVCKDHSPEVVDLSLD